MEDSLKAAIRALQYHDSEFYFKQFFGVHCEEGRKAVFAVAVAGGSGHACVCHGPEKCSIDFCEGVVVASKPQPMSVPDLYVVGRGQIC